MRPHLDSPPPQPSSPDVSGEEGQGGEGQRPGIGTTNEGALHAALKARLSQPGDLLEAPVDGYVVDIVRGDLLIEVQTRHFGSIRHKLEALLANHRVELVYPIPALKWIVQLDPADGQERSRRRSPKRGQLVDLFDELMRIPALIDHPNLTLVVALTHEEDVRCADGQGSWRRGGVSLVERRLIDVVELVRFSGRNDLLALLPSQVEQPFTTRSLARQMGIRIPQARRVAYCLRKLGLATRTGMEGHAPTYLLANSGEEDQR